MKTISVVIILPYRANRSKLLIVNIAEHWYNIRKSKGNDCMLTQVIGKYFIRTLQATQIKEDRYFHSIIHEDIDHIADDLRILHSENKKDTQVVSSDTGGLQSLLRYCKS